jgi:hypothetical protein
MTNYFTSNLDALHRGLAALDPMDNPSLNAPKLAGDIRVLLEDDSNYRTFNHAYNLMTDPSEPELADTIWTISDIDGWWNLADPEMPEIQRGFDDGMFDVTGRLQARILTLTGSIVIAKSNRDEIATASANARKALLTAFNLVKRGTWLIVDEDNYKRACFVRLSGRPDVKTVNNRGRIDFSIGLRAADPIKYEWIETTASTLPAGIAISGNGYNTANNYLPILATTDVLESYNRYGYTVNVETIAGVDSTTNNTYYRGYDDYGYVASTETVSGTVTQNTPAYYKSYGSVSFLYSTDLTSYTTITNHGTTKVHCYIRVTGPLYGPVTIKNITPGYEQTIQFVDPGLGNQILGPSASTSATEFIDINTYNREVRTGTIAGGVAVTSKASARGLLVPLVDWIYLAPGENTIYFEDTGLVGKTESSRPTMQVYWRSGWEQ